jgi:signal transduction histidine kinase
VNSLINELARLLRDDASRRGISIRLRLEKSLPNIKMDPIQIQQVLLNLAINGMDAMMESDRPRVLEICSGWYGTDKISIMVKDRGRGFSEQTLAKMFEPFFTTKPEGTGLGLSICRSIIEEHEGLIWASQSEQGAVVQFVLKVGV